MKVTPVVNGLDPANMSEQKAPEVPPCYWSWVKRERLVLARDIKFLSRWIPGLRSEMRKYRENHNI